MTRRFLFVATAAFLALAPSARAQLGDAKVLTLAAARAARVAAEAEANRNNWKVSIAVVDAAGELLIFTRLDGAPLSSIAIAQGKARTAARFRRPTRAMDSTITAGRIHALAFEGAVPVEGGVPIVVNGVVIGAVGVSGVTSAQDAQVAAAGVAAIKP